MTTRHRLNVVLATVLATGLAMSTPCASAQTLFEWAAPVDGFWSDAMGWAPEGVPSESDTATLGGDTPYTVFVDAPAAVDTLDLRNAFASTIVAAPSTLTLGSAIEGPGQLLIGFPFPTTSGAPTLRVLNRALIDSRITLGYNAGVFDTFAKARFQGPQNEGEFATIGSAGVLEGAGDITGSFANHGLILANVTGRVLDFSGTLDQTQGGRIRIENDGIYSTSGRLTGGSIFVSEGSRLASSTSTYSTITGTSIEFEPGSMVTGGLWFEDCLITGDLTLKQIGYIALAPSTRVEASITLTGSGTPYARLVLPDLTGLATTVTLAVEGGISDGVAIQGPLEPGEQATIAPDGVVRGRGLLFGRIRNEGLIVARGAGSEIVLSGPDPRDEPFYTVPQSPDGTIEVGDGGIITLAHRVEGGQIILGSGGTLAIPRTGNLTPLSDLALEGRGGTLSGKFFFVDSLLTGQIGIAGTGPVRVRSTTEVDADFYLSDDGINQPNGWLELSGGPVYRGTAVLAPAVFETATNRSKLSGGSSGFVIGETGGVRGTGILLGGIRNAGSILADATGETLTIDTNGPLVSTGILRAVNGGILELLSGLDGGTLTTSAGGVVSSLAPVRNTTLLGPILIGGPHGLRLGQGVDNQGAIVMGMAEGTSTLALDPGTELGGLVTLRRPNPANVGSPIGTIQGPEIGAGAASIGPDAIISGPARFVGHIDRSEGVIDLAEGDLRMNSVLELDAPLVIGERGALRVWLESASPYRVSQLVAESGIVLGGELTIRSGGPVPLRPNETVRVVRGGPVSGRFDRVTTTFDAPFGRVPRVFYGSDWADFAIACSSDFAAPVGVLDIMDILMFLELWSDPSEPDADFNHDGQRDIFDVIEFLQQWNAGCPE